MRAPVRWRGSMGKASSASAPRSFPASGWCAATTPCWAEQRTRKRQELLAATEKELTPIAAATRRTTRPLRGKDTIALRVGKVLNHYKMAKHGTLALTAEPV